MALHLSTENEPEKDEIDTFTKVKPYINAKQRIPAPRSPLLLHKRAAQGSRRCSRVVPSGEYGMIAAAMIIRVITATTISVP